MDERNRPIRISRRHVIQVFAAGVGSVLLPRRGALAWADLPWGEEPSATLLRPDGTPLALGTGQRYDKGARQIAPALTLVPHAGRLWTAWAEATKEREVIRLRSFSMQEGAWGPALELSASGDSAGDAYESDLALVGDQLVAVWSQVGRDGWSVNVRALGLATGEFAPVQRLSGSTEGEFHGHPAIAVVGNRALVVWQAKCRRDKTFTILGHFLTPDGRPAEGVFEIAADLERDCCHPAIAAAPDGRAFAVAFDRQDRPGTQNVYVVTVDSRSGRCMEPRPVSNHPAANVAPAIAYSPDGEWLYVAWHTNRRGEDGWDVPRWYRLAALRTRDNTWHAPPDQPEPASRDERGTVQGFELVRLAVSPRGVVCVLGRASHNFYVQYYSTEGRSPLYRLPEDGWGGRGRLLRGVFDGDGALWVTRRDLGLNVLHRIGGFTDLSGPPPVEPFNEASRCTIRCLTGVTPRYEWPKSTGPAEGLRVYLGDIHGHSWQSDGMGDPEESYLRARDVFRDDFHVLTDHDHFIQKRLTDAQWEEHKAIVEHYQRPGEFVTLFGQEWTTARTTQPHGWGHCNIYSADPAIPLFDHTDERYRDLPELYAAVRAHRAIAIPHHIGWTGVRWDVLDAELTPVVEICSVHGAYEYEGNEPIRHRGGLRGCFFRDGLARGLRVGVVGGTDQHGLIWQHGVCWKRDVYRAGLTGVWAPELSRETLLDALRARRTFATTGVKLWLYFAVNDALMGAAVETDKPPTIVAEVAIPPGEGRLDWLEIVRDGVPISRCGSEGPRTRHTLVDDACPSAKTACYYVRVKLADNNMAWSSPVWVTRT